MNKKKGMKSYRTSSWLKVDVKISPCLESTTYNRLAIFLCQKPTACNRLIMVMGGVCLEDKTTIISQK